MNKVYCSCCGSAARFLQEYENGTREYAYSCRCHTDHLCYQNKMTFNKVKQILTKAGVMPGCSVAIFKKYARFFSEMDESLQEFFLASFVPDEESGNNNDQSWAELERDWDKVMRDL